MIKFQKPPTQTNNYLAPAGTHIARCFKMIHLGTLQAEYKGEKKEKNGLWVEFELPGEMKVFREGEIEKPAAASIEYNLTSYETAKLFIHLNTWLGRTLSPQEIDDFDVSSQLGEPCMLTIVHNTSSNGRTYANINAVSGLPKGVICPAQINPPFVWDYDENFDIQAFDSFPHFIQEKIKSTPEWILKTEEIKEINVNAPHVEEVRQEINEAIHGHNDLPF